MCPLTCSRATSLHGSGVLHVDIDAIQRILRNEGFARVNELAPVSLSGDHDGEQVLGGVVHGERPSTNGDSDLEAWPALLEADDLLQ